MQWWNQTQRCYKSCLFKHTMSSQSFTILGTNCMALLTIKSKETALYGSLEFCTYVNIISRVSGKLCACVLPIGILCLHS